MQLKHLLIRIWKNSDNLLRKPRPVYLTTMNKWMSSKSPLPSLTNKQSATIDSNSTLVAVCQMTATNEKEENLQTCEILIEKAAKMGAKMVFLPEGCDYIAETKPQSLEFAESMSGPTVNKFIELAKSYSVWLSLGGVHIKEPGKTKLSNTHLVINDSGSIVGVYNKCHLFNIHLPEKNVNLMESSYVEKGTEIVPPISTVAGMLGLSVCYDIRFPEISMIQRRLGAELLTYPSAFTVATGLAHWEVLLRARAIENQCYVIAAAQTGQHNVKRSSYGHAMIVDPWGAVIAQTSEGQHIALAEIDISYLRKVRQEMPVMNHKRSDLYNCQLISSPPTPHLIQLEEPPNDYTNCGFGQVMVPGGCIFLQSKLSRAFVNKKPVVPGHSLVTPIKLHRRFTNLSEVELCDFSQTVYLANQIVLEEFEAESSQIAIQDGFHAGQTIEHVHAHIVPWKETQNRAVRSSDPVTLQKHEEKIEERNLIQMFDEATKLRKQANKQITDIYNGKSTELPQSIVCEKMIAGNKFLFENNEIRSKDILLLTEMCYAFKTINPILPGHAYVTFKEPIKNFEDLTPKELNELFQAIQKTQKIIEKDQDTNSSTIVILNGKIAGQHVEQVHAHVIPRIADDLINNDDIYYQIQNHNLLLSMPCTPDQYNTDKNETVETDLS